MRTCYRNLDSPIIFFGLELEDIGVLGLLAGLEMIFFDATIGAGIFFGGWFVLKVLKRGKPSGYVVHFLYKLGLDIPGLIMPPKRVPRYCAFSPIGKRVRLEGLRNGKK